MRKRLLLLVGVASFVVALPMLMGPSGGLPSRPRFQALGVGTVAPTRAGDANVGTSTFKQASTTNTAFTVGGPEQANFFLREDNAAANEKIWRIAASDGSLLFIAPNDAESAATTFANFARTGTTIDSLDLTLTTLSQNGFAVPKAASGVFTGVGAGCGASVQSKLTCTPVGSGSYTVNLAAGFTVAPSCVVSVSSGSNISRSAQTTATPTTTAVSVVHYLVGTGAAEGPFAIICIGV